jgi:predicted DsbA family dithiol-disulfide isomerase
MITVYHDFLCPFAWRGLELLAALEIPFTSRHFSLLQGNHPDNAGLPRNAPAWKLVDQTPGATPNAALPAYFNNIDGSLEAFFASHAALHQGHEAHLRFALELYRARHRDEKVLNAQTALEAAHTAKLDMSAFKAAMADDTARRAELAIDLEAAGKLGVFGTPTVQLETGDIAYFRFSNLPESQEAKLEAWKLFEGTLTSGARIETIKRAKP